MKTAASLPPLPVRRKSEPCCATLAPPALSEHETAILAATLKALGDESRLRMLDLLVQQPEPLCVCDITAQFAQNQPTISHHLRLLREAGLIDTEKRGIWSYYWATAEGRAALTAVRTLL